MNRPRIRMINGVWVCGPARPGINTSLHFWASTYTGFGPSPRRAWNDYCYRNNKAHRAVHPWN